MESIPELKAEFVCIVWRREKKNTSKIHLMILRYIKNVNLPFKKDLKFAEFLTKTSCLF